MDKNLHVKTGQPYFSDQSFRLSALKIRVRHCRITIFYIKIPKFEIKNCKDCFNRL